MYESQVNEYKYEIERLARELQDVKKKYFMQKKKEQAARRVSTLKLIKLNDCINASFCLTVVVLLIAERKSEQSCKQARHSYSLKTRRNLASLEAGSTSSSRHRHRDSHFQAAAVGQRNPQELYESTSIFRQDAI